MSLARAPAASGLGPSVTPEELAKFCEFFYRHTGILFTDKKTHFVERRLAERVAETGAGSFRSYFNNLRFQASGEELQSLVNLMTVNETYFFREDYQFTAMVTGMLPEIVRARKPGDAVSIWSIPCSTGEEPYSIAIQLLEHWSRVDDFDVEIRASDIDTRVLADARKGIYSARSVHRLSEQLQKKYFRRIGPDALQLRDEIRDSVDFALTNLADERQTARYRGIDIIFCRNLLIYFDDQSRRRSVETLFDCLAPGGFLCLGHSESMSRISSLLQPRSFGGTIVYQKNPRGE